MRTLGIDYGDSRCGFAITDALGITVQGLETLHSNGNDKLILKMTEYPDEYFCIWTKYCDLFFNFLKINCPDVKVILNKSRQVDKVQKANKTTYINHDFSFNASIINPLLDKLDSYIINNYDVHVLDFDYENTFVDENHLWGIGPVHYSKNHYYSYF